MVRQFAGGFVFQPYEVLWNHMDSILISFGWITIMIRISPIPKLPTHQSTFFKSIGNPDPYIYFSRMSHLHQRIVLLGITSMGEMLFTNV